MNLGHWTTSLFIPDFFYGFVYRVTNLATNKYYIGKKQAVFKRTLKPKKGKVNNRISSTESDWKYYTGSSNKLNADIDRYGKDVFKFEIVKFCDTKFDLSYTETQLLVMGDCLFDPNCYNEYLGCKLRKCKP